MKSKIQNRRAGFTMIEMLAVIAIIVILAGLIIAGLSFAKEKTARDKAKVQIGLLQKALEEYKLDNGNYPPATGATGENATTDLYRALYLDGANDTTKAKKIYVDLDPVNNRQGWTSGTGDNVRIIDPWGNEYRYRTGDAASNPDFDLWSVGKDGRTSTSTSNQNTDDTRDDIRTP